MNHSKGQLKYLNDNAGTYILIIMMKPSIVFIVPIRFLAWPTLTNVDDFKIIWLSGLVSTVQCYNIVIDEVPIQIRKKYKGYIFRF